MITILFVDDEEAIRGLVKNYLEVTGELAVDLAPGAEAAAAMMKESIYDAIVCDYEMPGGMNGIRFLQQLRSEGSTIPFLIFTGRGQEEVAIEAINNGADFYIQKGRADRAQFADLVQKVSQAVQRRRTENALRESEKNYRDLVESHPDVILTTDVNGDVTYVNRSGISQLGLHPDPMLHQPWTDIVKDDGKQQAETAFFRMMRFAEPIAGLLLRILNRTKPRGIPVVVNGSVLKDDRGAIRGARIVIRDLSLLQETEDDLYRVSETLAMVRQIAPVAIITLDTREIVTSWNPAAADLFGWTEQETVRKRLPFVPPETYPEYQQIFTRCLSARIVQQVRFRARSHDNSPVGIHLSAAPLHNATGEVQGVLLLAVKY